MEPFSKETHAEHAYWTYCCTLITIYCNHSIAIHRAICIISILYSCVVLRLDLNRLYFSRRWADGRDELDLRIHDEHDFIRCLAAWDLARQRKFETIFRGPICHQKLTSDAQWWTPVCQPHSLRLFWVYLVVETYANPLLYAILSVYINTVCLFELE